MLEIKNLSVACEEKIILDNLNLKIETGKIHVIMGPNGSGKTTLAKVLMGHPKYKIIHGEILLYNKSIIGLSPEELAKKGVFLSFQTPLEIPGITLSNFIRKAYNSIKEKKFSVLEFRELLEKKAKEIDLKREFLDYHINKGFSGGEKKKSEILQMLVLNPSIAILDETDSGLDIDSLKSVSKGILNFIKENSSNENKSILIITHYKRILEYLHPDKVSIMINGKIVMEGDESLIYQLEKKGYGWLKEESKNLEE
ncbi:Fe-S cluster assembly ATPase SufC [Patescibacteria group bacterium]|nr:Fe-S cluster assembly ATPase SufC [Patescibacteria group bacterium]